MYWVLAVLGLVVGFMNIAGNEAKTFLLAAIGLMLLSTSVMAIPVVGLAVTAVVSNVVAFIAAAVLSGFAQVAVRGCRVLRLFRRNEQRTPGHRAPGFYFEPEEKVRTCRKLRPYTN